MLVNVIYRMRRLSGGRYGACLGVALWAGLGCGTVQAQETNTYTYDALGRLTNVTTSGGPSNGVTQEYQYDPAGNRTQQTVTGSSNPPPPPAAVIVLPINGFTIIPLP